MSELGNPTRTIRFFWRHASRYPFLLWGMILSYPVAMLFRRFLPALVVANMLDRLADGDFVSGDVWGSFGPEIVLAVGMSAVGGIGLMRLTTYCNWKMEGLVIRDINRQVFDHLMHLSARFHANRFGGSLVSQTNKLAGAYIRFTDTSLFQVSALFWTLVFTSVLLWQQATVFVILLNIFCLLFIISAFFATRGVRYLNQKEAEAENKQTGQLADSVTNVMAVKSFSAGKSENRRFGGVTEFAREALMRVMFATIKAQTVFTSINTVIFALAVVSLVASIVVYDTNIGVVFLIFSYVQEIRNYLWEFGNTALRNYNRAFGDAYEMMEILDIEPDVKDPATPEKPRINKGAITFQDMRFTHAETNSDDSLFAGLNLDIKPGEKIGLVGHSGSGKTTLAKLLMRFDDIDGGHILIDGQDITHITQDDLRSHIAYVPQEPMLFHRSIRENIAYSKPGATDEDVFEAARQAHAAEFIENLPNGYETLVGERGVKLSGGQRQRIAIARALLKDAPILLLDEATSALDSESEQLIQDALWKLMQGRTAIIIAHRLSTIQRMDRIIVLENGTIAEEGSHTQLLKRKGTYARLWSHQSGGFIEE